MNKTTRTRRLMRAVTCSAAAVWVVLLPASALAAPLPGHTPTGDLASTPTTAQVTAPDLGRRSVRLGEENRPPIAAIPTGPRHHHPGNGGAPRNVTIPSGGAVVPAPEPAHHHDEPCLPSGTRQRAGGPGTPSELPPCGVTISPPPIPFGPYRPM